METGYIYNVKVYVFNVYRKMIVTGFLTVDRVNKGMNYIYFGDYSNMILMRHILIIKLLFNTKFHNISNDSSLSVV
jgi:hypothetical protein